MTARVPLDKLPPALRKQVAEMVGGESRTRAPKGPERARPARVNGAAVRCVGCGQVFARYGKAVEDHVDQEHGGGRIDVVLAGPAR
jgi:hypothetical protein